MPSVKQTELSEVNPFGNGLPLTFYNAALFKLLNNFDEMPPMGRGDQISVQLPTQNQLSTFRY